MGILLKDVCYRYQGKYQTVQAVNGISYDFESGKLYAIVGKSGSGKTTLLSLMAGLDLRPRSVPWSRRWSFCMRSCRVAR